MKISVKNGDRGNLYDVHGREIRDVVSADTWTGKVKQIARDIQGQAAVGGWPGRERVKLIKHRYDPPLTFIRAS